MSLETIILLFVAVDIILLLLVWGIGSGMKRAQRRREWLEIREPPNRKAPPND